MNFSQQENSISDVNTKRLKVLQFGVINTSNVPRNYMQMLREQGFYSRMATLWKSPNNYEEDICVNWGGQNGMLLNWWRNYKLKKWIENNKAAGKLQQSHITQIPPVFKYHNFAERILGDLRNFFLDIRAKKIIKRWNLDSFDIYHFHDGIEFSRNGTWVKSLRSRGKKIVCHYHGMDLRFRGVIPSIDNHAHLVITNEFDLLALHPRILYIPIPFKVESYPFLAEKENNKLLIIHTPSIRMYKGTDTIEKCFKEISALRRVDCLIVSNRPHSEIIELKKKANLAIEQVGNLGGTGYGVNSLENLALGVPTITEFTPEYSKFLGEHPFVLATKENLRDVILELIDNPEKLRLIALNGRRWVERTHSYPVIFDRLMELYRQNGIL